MWLWCFEHAWLRDQSPAHTCMWSLLLTSQVGTGSHWCSAGIQCSFHSSWILLERNRHCWKGYRCPKIPLESTSNYSSYGNTCGFVYNWHHGTFNSSLLKFIHIFSSGNTHRVAALCWESFCQNQSEHNNTAWKSQSQPKWSVPLLSLTSLSVIFRVSKGK